MLALGSDPVHSEVPLVPATITGASVSEMVNVAVVEAALAQASVAVNVTVIVLTHPPLQVPGVFVQVIVLPQASVAVAPA